MSAIDRRIPVPFWINHGTGAMPHESRLVYPDFDILASEVLTASCINSMELLLSWGYDERVIVRLLFSAMKFPKGKSPELCLLSEVPKWIQLVNLSRPTLVSFKRHLLRAIEKSLITEIDPDREEFS